MPVATHLEPQRVHARHEAVELRRAFDEVFELGEELPCLRRNGVHGAQLEITDGLDNDCDGAVDEGATARRWYPDLDGDAFGDPSGTPVSM